MSITQPPPGGAQAVVGVFGPNKAAMEAALERVERLKRVLEPGEVVTGTVVDVKPFGWILRTEDGDEGLMHVTELMHTNARVESGDHLPLGRRGGEGAGRTERQGVRFSRRRSWRNPRGTSRGFRRKRPGGAPAGDGLGARGSETRRGEGDEQVRAQPDGTSRAPVQRIANE